MNDTITPEYLELNRQLHAAGGYGNGSYRWSDTVMRLRDDTGSKTVLDYGCGKGVLGQVLGNPDWFREYDPAIDGKDTPPETADLVICTDVLEHVEPELLDNVLQHIADLSARGTFLVISIRKAEKTLADGRNAHLIVESPEWWRKKLEKYFLIGQWGVFDDEIRMLGSTIRSISHIKAKSAVSDTLRLEQAIENCRRVTARVTGQDRHEGRCAVVCYGPSLHDTWSSLKIERRLHGTTIVSVSGAHDFLIERGIVPDIHVECDPREHKAFFTRNPHPSVRYWIASCCHAKTIDRLIENDLSLWHVYNSDDDFKIIAPDGPDPGNTLIAGGGSVGCRAVNLMFTQGYRTFSIFGMDCSFSEAGEQHAGEHSGKMQHEANFKVGERWFKSSGSLVYTARGFIQNLGVLNRVCAANNEPSGVQIMLNGDGLLQEMAKQALKGENYAA